MVCNAQVDQVTGNLVYTTVNPPPSGAQYNWGGFVNNNTGGGGTSGGNVPAYNSQTGTFIFGYNQGTVAYNMAVNNALANAGVGIQVQGLNYSWQYYNQDFSRGTLSGTIGLTDSTGKVLHSYNYTMPKTTEGWTVMSGTNMFPVAYAPNTLGNLTVSFTGKDDRYWAGFYGPQIREIDVRLRYGVDTCVLNPASNPDCPGYKNIVESGNIIPYTNNLNNVVVLNQAFKNSGSGMEIYGFNYGFSASAGDYCAFQLIVCFDNRYPSASVNVNITNNMGSGIYSQNYTIRNNSGNFGYQYLFPETKTLGSLGAFSFSASKDDNAYVGNFYARALYMPDICTRNPGNNPSCPGYVAPQTSSIGPSSTTETTAPATTLAQTSSLSSGQTMVSEPTPTSTVSSTSSTPQQTSTPTSTTSVTPTANNPQPRVGEVVVAGSQTSSQQSSSSSGPSLGQVLNSIRNEQNRLSKLEMSVAGSAVEQTKQEASKSLNEAQSVAAAQQEQTLSSAQNLIASQTVSGGGGGQTTGSSSNNQSVLGTGLLVMVQPASTQMSVSNAPIAAPLQPPVSYTLQSQNFNNQVVMAMPLERPVAVSSFSQPQINNQPVSVSSVQPSATFNMNSSFRDEQETVRVADQTTASASNLRDPTNPLSSALTPRSMPAQPAAPSGPVVNTRAQDNDAAGGVSMAAVAAQPPGFELYSNGLRDAPFYPPREIYRNQRVVDNQRAERALNQRSDQLHNQMIEQQYRDNR